MKPTKFTNYNRVEARYGQSLSVDELRSAVPSAFAAEKHASRSDKYVYVPTEQIVHKMISQNFLPVFACQSRPRLEDKRAHAKHMIRFRQGGAALGVAEVPEVVLVNSHDGSSSYNLMAGIFRMVCCNGMITGDKFETVSVHHTGNILDGIIDGAFTVVNDFERALASVKQMKEITLSPDEQGVFAAAAADLRFEPEADKPLPMPANRLLDVRRDADRAKDLWTTFNVIQENVIRGGQSAVSRHPETGRRQRKSTREVKGIDGNIRLNRALWTLAERLAELKAKDAVPA